MAGWRVLFPMRVIGDSSECRAVATTRSCQAGTEQPFERTCYELGCRDLAEYLVPGPRVVCGDCCGPKDSTTRISTRKSVFTCTVTGLRTLSLYLGTPKDFVLSAEVHLRTQTSKNFSVPTENQSGCSTGQFHFILITRPQLNITSLFCTKSAIARHNRMSQNSAAQCELVF